MTSFLQRAPRALMLALVLSVVILFGTPRTVLAHGHLTHAVPATDTQLSVAPRELRLTFSEAPELAVSHVELTGPTGSILLDSLLGVPNDPLTVVAAIRGGLISGVYTVAWKTAGADGHPVHGEYTFTILPSATGLTPSAPAGEAGGRITPPGAIPAPAMHHADANTDAIFDAQSPLYVVVRWVQFAALVILFGAVTFHFGVLGFLRRREHFSHHPDSSIFPLARNRTATVGYWAAVALLISAILRMFAQSVAMHGAANALDSHLLATILTRTVWGWGWLLQVIAAIVAMMGFVWAKRGTGSEGTGTSQAGWAMAALAATVAAFTPALAGHAASSSYRGLALLADGLHVLGAGGWLGSLLVLVIVGIPAAMTLETNQRGPAVADLVNAFSPTALGFSGIIVTTGVFSAWLRLGTLSALVNSTYGKTLLLKLAILSIVVATGAYNWLRVKPALGEVRGAQHLRRSALVELAIGLAVLLITAILVGTPTPME